MVSFRTTVTPSRRSAGRFIAKVRRELVKALADERAENGTCQADLARALDVHRSVVSRELTGRKDITLGRIGELAWALGREPVFELRRIEKAKGDNKPPQTSGAVETKTRALVERQLNTQPHTVTTTPQSVLPTVSPNVRIKVIA